ncbi:MAG: 3-methylornithyl-N6-L-lysine dehydrogenase PylD [Desulfobacterales bacterium]|nr:MAG: 3-methylornithyl-N6-L-lysine dehydrogenase PylD [Desulfobacterales bacterium]
MTRLRSGDIAEISTRLSAYDEELLAKTGRTLKGLACYAVGLDEEEIAADLAGAHIGVVPIGWGQGVIDGFAETTRDILKHLGFHTFITNNSNASGLAEALEKHADIIFLSDDDHFLALNVECRRVVDNAEATGKGFAAGLNLMAGGLQGHKTLVIGCGPVGISAATTLANYGAKISLYDIDRSRSHQLAGILAGMPNHKIEIEPDLKRALGRHRFLIEATNSADIIAAQDLSPTTYIGAPGIPLGLSREAAEKISARLLHDPLQTGVATMGLAALKQILSQKC